MKMVSNSINIVHQLERSTETIKFLLLHVCTHHIILPTEQKARKSIFSCILVRQSQTVGMKDLNHLGARRSWSLKIFTHPPPIIPLFFTLILFTQFHVSHGYDICTNHWNFVQLALLSILIHNPHQFHQLIHIKCHLLSSSRLRWHSSWLLYGKTCHHSTTRHDWMQYWTNFSKKILLSYCTK